MTLTIFKSTVLREVEQTDSGFNPLKAILKLILDWSVSEARLRSSEDLWTKLVIKKRDKARKEIDIRVNKLEFLDEYTR